MQASPVEASLCVMLLAIVASRAEFLRKIHLAICRLQILSLLLTKEVISYNNKGHSHRHMPALNSDTIPVKHRNLELPSVDAATRLFPRSCRLWFACIVRKGPHLRILGFRWPLKRGVTSSSTRILMIYVLHHAILVEWRQQVGRRF